MIASLNNGLTQKRPASPIAWRRGQCRNGLQTFERKIYFALQRNDLSIAWRRRV
nr:MAG TPA: hypothetical protein [Caudoviricetes sp.]